MKRRTLLKSFVAAVATRPAAALAAQTPAASTFSSTEIDTLNAIADVVLPDEIGADARRRAVTNFASWFANYRQGADMGHGYGASTLRAPAGASPVSRYAAQFAALDAAARSRGAQSFRTLSAGDRRAVVEQFLNEPQPVNRLPAQPTGANLVADLMGSYFTSANAWDVCYGVQILRDSCRSLDNSEAAPLPIRRR